MGMVLTTTAPALVAASQQATMDRLVGCTDQHAVTGPHAVVLDQRAREPVGPVWSVPCRFRRLPLPISAVLSPKPFWTMRSVSSTADIQPLGIVEVGQMEIRNCAAGGRLSREKVSICAPWSQHRYVPSNTGVCLVTNAR